MSMAGFVSCQTLGNDWRMCMQCSRCNFGKLRNHLNISFIASDVASFTFGGFVGFFFFGVA